MNNDRSACQVMLPFRVKTDPMEKLLVANINGHPDFDGIEPQVFDDVINGKGMRVRRYRKDGKVDVYWQSGANVVRDSITVGAGMGDFAETAIEPAHFEVTERGVDRHIAFTDVQGRSVVLRIQEDMPRQRGFPWLAPVGAEIKKPRQLFFVYMPEIGLVRRARTIVDCRIGEDILRPASFPVPLHGRRTLFIRYAVKPIIGVLNPPMNRPVTAEISLPGNAEVDGMGSTANEHGCITRPSAGQASCQIEVDFLRGIPNLLDITDSDTRRGQWTIQISGNPVTGGAFEISKRDANPEVGLDVLDHWKPTKLPPSIILFTRVVSTFRSWPSTYRWRGVINPDPVPAMSGLWERVRR